MALPKAHAPDRPASFGKYELLGLLGAGGMAEVFLARSVGPMGFERRVVVKRILPHLSRDEEFVEMFVGEAKVSALLSHGNIVQVYDFGEADGHYYLAMEHVEGADLRTLCRKAGLAGTAIPPEVSAFIVTEVLSALAHAHERADWHGQPLGLVHRDVSPSNVLLSRAGEVKLCDFGIAKIAARHTSTGRLKGKFAYMSPEQAGGAPVDGRSDLWSAGVILWELLTGQRLFQADSDVGIIALVSRGDIPRLPRLGCANEELLRAVIDRALERDPARRYPDATAMAEDLLEFIAGAEIRDPSRIVRELVQRFAVEPTPTTATPSKAAPRAIPPVARGEATALLPSPEVPTELRPVSAAPPTHSAIVERRRSPVLAIVVVVGILAVVAGLVLALWPAPERPVPHATPGWPPAGVTPLLPPLPRTPVAPPPPPAPRPWVAPPQVSSDAEPVRVAPAPPPREVRTPRTPRATRTDDPLVGSASERTAPSDDAAPRPAAPPEPDGARPGSTRETTVDPFAIQ